MKLKNWSENNVQMFCFFHVLHKYAFRFSRHLSFTSLRNLNDHLLHSAQGLPKQLPRPLERQKAFRPWVYDQNIEGQQHVPPMHVAAEGMPQLEAAPSNLCKAQI